MCKKQNQMKLSTKCTCLLMDLHDEYARYLVRVILRYDYQFVGLDTTLILTTALVERRPGSLGVSLPRETQHIPPNCFL